MPVPRVVRPVPTIPSQLPSQNNTPLTPTIQCVKVRGSTAPTKSTKEIPSEQASKSVQKICAQRSTFPSIVPAKQTTQQQLAKNSFEYQLALHKKNNEKIINAIPPSIPVKDDIGKFGLMWPRGLAISHPAAKMLEEFSTMGCPVDTGKNWSINELVAAIKRGPHISAREPEAAKYLHMETQEKIKGGYLTITTWGKIKNNHPPNLKISPVAMIPHKSRSYRCILDLSFRLKVKNKKISSVNLGTVLRAPQKSMAHLGMVVRRLIHLMADNYDPKHPFVFSKCDIKDGFWRMVVSLKDAWNFAYVLPPKSGVTSLDDTEIVIPHALQMGWAESPPFFCAATETGRDIIEQLYTTMTALPKHNLEHHLLQEILSRPEQVQTREAASAIEVYVDDFIACTNNSEYNNITHLARAMLHGIHSLFPPPSVTGHAGEDPIALKKLLEKEGMFQYEKEVLGWMFNGKTFTISLPNKKRDKISLLLESMLKNKYTTLKPLEKLQGKLIHASLGIPGGRGLLSPLYRAVATKSDKTAVTGDLRQCMKDWKILIKEIASRPTSVHELVARDPHYIGYADASKRAVGGVWVNGTKSLNNFWVWRLEWPADIQASLNSTNNQHTLSINDLEMAGTLLAWLVLEQITSHNLHLAQVGLFCDNDSTVNWHYKKSTSTSVVAGHLLRALALRLHINRAAPLQTLHIAGKENKMADMASRSFTDNIFTNSNKTFIDVFSTQFPLQNTSWKEYHIPKKITSKVISCLRGKPLAMASWTTIIKQEKNIGTIGKSTQEPSNLIHTSQSVQAHNRSSSSPPSLHASGQVTTAKVILSEFQQLQKHWQPSPRPSNWLENRPLSTNQKKRTKRQWHGSLRDTEEKIRLQHLNSHSQS